MKEQKENGPHSHSSSADTMKAGVERNRGSSTLAPSSSASTLLSSSRSLYSRSSHSDASLCTSSSAGNGTHLPAFGVERESSTALLHLTSASRNVDRLPHPGCWCPGVRLLSPCPDCSPVTSPGLKVKLQAWASLLVNFSRHVSSQPNHPANFEDLYSPTLARGLSKP
jgi:hypothetical protein